MQTEARSLRERSVGLQLIAIQAKARYLCKTTMFRKRKYDGGDSREMGLKRNQPYAQGPSLYGGMPGGPNMMYPAGAFGYPNQPPLFPVVRLRGLPFDITEGDVVDFFQGLDLIDILFVHKGGRFSGEAFCMLAYPVQDLNWWAQNQHSRVGSYNLSTYYILTGLKSAQENVDRSWPTIIGPILHGWVKTAGPQHTSPVEFALQRNRQNIGRRYIEVFRCKREEYYTAVAQEVSSSKFSSSPRRTGPPSRSKPSADGSKDDHVVYTGILRMRGLPFSAGKEEIIDFFKEFELTEDMVHLVVNPDGRPSGEAFVEFRSAEDSKEAMKNDRMTLGSRYIELFPSHMKEMDEAIVRERL
ncbi:hypothetical protein LUZ63_002543 [Rhynchospora breviuscula]|uniref:RRM domain-containing protein n=1 Tax=Rhynchospora breviuscula TaxID=2022672 RepID=A0A9Q0HXX7_9POAL|nr:hypothetical protein LUZ63_002543 [Rhynchospora breviuscula]